jgi:hypothetical protein
MSEFRIRVTLSALLPWGSPINAASFPTLAFAVRSIGEAAHRQWVAYASGLPLPDGKVINPRTGEYARSIQLRQTGPFSAEVYTDLPYARGIEEGTPARDMKRMLNSSLKVRVTAKGKRYLIIPFRWNTPNSVLGRAMPQPLHAWWQSSAAAPSRTYPKSFRISKACPRSLISSAGDTFRNKSNELRSFSTSTSLPMSVSAATLP